MVGENRLLSGLESCLKAYRLGWDPPSPCTSHLSILLLLQRRAVSNNAVKLNPEPMQ